MSHRQTIRNFGILESSSDYMAYENIIWTFSWYKMKLAQKFHRLMLMKKVQHLPNRCWPLRGWKTRPKKEHHPTEEDGKIGTNHSLPLERGALFNRFSVSRPMDPLMWLAGLLALSGDVETNPGPTTQTWTCDMCSTEITRRQTSYRCNSSPSHWVHEHCTTLRRNTDYTPTWKCNIHNQQNNTITDQHHQLTDNNNNMQQNLNINQPHSINNNR